MAETFVGQSASQGIVMFGIASQLGLVPYINLIRARLFPRRMVPLRTQISSRCRGKIVFEAIRACAAEHSVPCFFGGGGKHGSYRLHVRDIDAPLLLSALRSLNIQSDWVQFSYEGKRGPLADLPQLNASFDLIVEELSDHSVKPALSLESVIRVDIWRPLTSYSAEQLYDAGRPNQHFARVRKSTLDRLADERADLDQRPLRDIFQPDFDVDVVYTWVDGSDPAWGIRREARTLGMSQMGATSAARSTLGERYRSRDELLYSLRSVDFFAPFVRKIWLVTDGQVPRWLKPSARLTVVDHRDIFRNLDVLPTFNSSAIETQLHHIDGLAEHFIYFNDDFFLGQRCDPTDFFSEAGLLKYFPSNQRINESDIDDEREEYLVADRNANRLFERDFGFVGRILMRHVPYPSRRSLLFELEKRYQDEFDECASRPFRSTRDLRPIAFMQYPFALYLGQAVRGSISHRYLPLWKPDIERNLDVVRNTRRWKTFCINDVGVTSEREAPVDEAVRGFLEAYFPIKSCFEN